MKKKKAMQEQASLLRAHAILQAARVTLEVSPHITGEDRMLYPLLYALDDIIQDIKTSCGMTIDADASFQGIMDRQDKIIDMMATAPNRDILEKAFAIIQINLPHFFCGFPDEYEEELKSSPTRLLPLRHKVIEYAEAVKALAESTIKMQQGTK